jgi:hypothetical protein
MTIRPIRREERDPRRINEAIEQLMQGRSNAHGSFTLTNDGVATTTVVNAPTCSSNSHVNVTPTTANAYHVMGWEADNSWYIVAGNGSFTVHHAATALANCTFTFSING